MAIVAAAGNDGDSAAKDPASVRSPCLVAVGAEQENGRMAGFSSYGQNPRELNAPGRDIASTWPGGGVGIESGTSMAAPFESGTLALLVGMGVPPQEAIAITLITARYPKGHIPERRLFYGAGNVNAEAACRYADHLGFGTP